MNLIKKGTYTNKGVQKSGYLGVIGKLLNTEISELILLENKSAVLYPPENDKLKEFCYLISGRLDANGLIIEPGDSFFVDSSIDSVYITAIEKSKLLYLSETEIIANTADSMNKLHALISILDERDPYTSNHSHRVSVISAKIATHLKLESSRLELLNRASIFHDIGKLEIPAEILTKPGKLSDSEFDLIKKHPTYGYQIAKEHNFPKEAEIILQHHERIDGSGYPNGLSNKEISLEAKIIAVADSYDAMTKDRPYRFALSHEEAVAELIKYTDLRYDKQIVNALIEIIKA